MSRGPVQLHRLHRLKAGPDGNHQSYYLLRFAGQTVLYFAIHHCQL